MNDDPIKCSACGKFISYAELSEGGSARFYFEPDSHRGPEISEWTCGPCLDKSYWDARNREAARS